MTKRLELFLAAEAAGGMFGSEQSREQESSKILGRVVLVELDRRRGVLVYD